MAHTKVYGFCDAKCKVEVVPKKGGEFTGDVTTQGMIFGNYQGTNTKFDTVVEKATPILVIRGYGNSFNIAGYKNPDSTSMRMNVCNAKGSWAQLDFINPDDGSGAHISHPSPKDPADNSNKSATCYWVNTASSVVHTTGAQVIDGNKVFNDDYVLHSVGNTDAGYWEKLITLPIISGTSQMNVHLELIESFRNSHVRTTIARLMLVATDNGATANWVSVNGSDTFDTSRFKVVFTSEGKTELWYCSTHSYWSCSCRVINANMRNAPYKITDISMESATTTTVEGTDVPIGNPTSAIPTPSDATGNEIAVASWVNGKLAGHNHDDRYYTESEINSKLAGNVKKIALTGTVSGSKITASNVQSGDLVSVIVRTNENANYSAFTFMLPVVSGTARVNTTTPARLMTTLESGDFWEYLLVGYYNNAWEIELRRATTSDLSYASVTVTSFEGFIMRG